MYKQDISTQSFQTHIVGTTFANRQTVVVQLVVGEEVYLVREPDNPFDGNAVKVCRGNDQQIGYLDRYLAATISPQLDQCGEPVKAVVSALTGGFYPGSNIGVLVQFVLPK